MTKLEQRLAQLEAIGATVVQQGPIFVVYGKGEIIKLTDVALISEGDLDRLSGREPVSRWIDKRAST